MSEIRIVDRRRVKWNANITVERVSEDRPWMQVFFETWNCQLHRLWWCFQLLILITDPVFTSNQRRCCNHYQKNLTPEICFQTLIVNTAILWLTMEPITSRWLVYFNWVIFLISIIHGLKRWGERSWYLTLNPTVETNVEPDKSLNNRRD